MSALRPYVRSIARSSSRRKAVAVGTAAGLATVVLVAPASAAIPATVAQAAVSPFAATKASSEAPVTLKATYKLDGKKVSRDEIVGKSGLLETTYVVRNTTVKPTELRYKDGNGKEIVETVDVVTPYVGRLVVGLPGNFKQIEADGAENSGETLAWSLILFDPIGEPAQQLRWTAQVSDAEIPPASLEVAKVTPTGKDVLSKGLATAEEASGGSTRLTEGVMKIDSSVLKLRDGATQLLEGLIKLADGSAKLNAGLADSAAPGAQKLSDGLGQARAGGGKLDDGVGQLADGSVKLSEGLGKASAGGARLGTGLAELAGGADKLAAGLGAASAGGTKLGEGLGKIEDGLGAAKDGSSKLAVGLGSASEGADALAGGLPAIADGLDKVQAGLTQLGVALPAGLDTAIKQVQGAVEQFAVGAYINGMVAGIDTKMLPGFDQILSSVPASKGGLQCAAVILNDVALGAAPAAPGSHPCWPDGRPALPGTDATSQAVLGGVGTKLTEAAAGLGDASLEPGDDGFEAGTLAGGLQLLKAGAGGVRAGLDRPSLKDADGNVLLDANGRPVDPGGLKQFLLEQINGGLTKVNLGVSGALTTALGAPTADPESPLAKTLIGGTSLLAAGADKAAEGSGRLAGGLQLLSDGGTKLDGGLGQLLAGSTQASDGADALNAGLTQLADGGQKLAAGSHKASDGSGELLAGLDQLAAGGVKLSDGLGAARAGTGKLLDGLVQLDEGGAKLATGLGDAADGSGQIADGIVKVRDGVKQVRDGANELSGRGTSALGGSVNSAAQVNARKVAMLQALSSLSEQSTEDAAFDVVLTGSEDDDPNYALLGAGAAGLALLALGGTGYVLARRRDVG